MCRKIDIKLAEKIRTKFENRDDVGEDSFEHFFTKPTPAAKKPKSVTVKPTVYSRYFKANTPQKEIEETIEKALKAYFSK
jgi:hypothetical protein